MNEMLAKGAEHRNIFVNIFINSKYNLSDKS